MKTKKIIFSHHVFVYEDYLFNGLKFQMDKPFETKKACRDWFQFRYENGTDADQEKVKNLINNYLHDKLHVFISWLLVSKQMPKIHIIIGLLLYQHYILSITIVLMGSLWILAKKVLQEKIRIINFSIDNHTDERDYTFYFSDEWKEYLKNNNESKL